MSEAAPEVGPLVAHLFREEYGKLVAVLSRRFGLGRLEVAEDLVQETLMAAVHHWPLSGVPDNPAAWLMQVAKHKALNLLKHEGRKQRIHGRLADDDEGEQAPDVFLSSDIEDHLLRMVFACCHPALTSQDQLALILKTVCGLGSAEVARALLVSQDAVDKRLYRARRTLVDEHVTLEVPGGADLDARLATTCQSLYLLFNEGYLSTSGEEAIRRDVCREAMRLMRLLVSRFDDRPEVAALLALMCFHAARFNSRLDEHGALLLLDEQDRRQWDRALIQEGLQLLGSSARGEQLTRYHLEASIAAQHCLAPSLRETNWSFIEQLYERLFSLTGNPVVRLNRLVVRAQRRGAAEVLEEAEALAADRRLSRYPLFWIVLGALQRRADKIDDARSSFELALRLAPSPRETEVLSVRLADLPDG